MHRSITHTLLRITVTSRPLVQRVPNSFNLTHCLPRHLLAFVLRPVAVYGQFLLATGVYGYYMSGYAAKAKHGAFMGMGGDVAVSPMPAASLICVCADLHTHFETHIVWLCASPCFGTYMPRIGPCTFFHRASRQHARSHLLVDSIPHAPFWQRLTRIRRMHSMQMCLMAVMSMSSIKPVKMIGIHLGMTLPALFSGVFAWQASKQVRCHGNPCHDLLSSTPGLELVCVDVIGPR
jgi:hypothetical protein